MDPVSLMWTVVSAAGASRPMAVPTLPIGEPSVKPLRPLPYRAWWARSPSAS